MRSLELKICGLRDAANIAEVASLHPTYMGFIFVPSSPRFVGDDFSLTTDALPRSIKRVGVFQNASLELIQRKVSECELHGVQLHGDEDDTYLRRLREALPALEIIRAVKVSCANDIATLPSSDDLQSLYLFDSRHPGSGSSFSWEWLKEYTGTTPFLIAGGVGVHNVQGILDLRKDISTLRGIDINSRVEIAPGMKSIPQIREIQERLKV